MSTCKVEKHSQLLLLISDSRINFLWLPGKEVKKGICSVYFSNFMKYSTLRETGTSLTT